MLRTRLILGTIFVAALVGLCWLDFHAARPGVVLLPLAIALALAGVGELLAMWKQRNDQANPRPCVVYAGTFLTIFAAGAPIWLPTRWLANDAMTNFDWLALGLVGSLWLALIGELQRFDKVRNSTMNLALGCLAVTYVGGLLGILLQLRLLSGGSWGRDGRWGMLALVSLMVIVKMSDIGQYTVGRLLGKHKLAPKISPGKTWEGALGGITFAILAALLIPGLGSRGTEGVAALGTAPTNIVAVCLYAAAIAVAGIIGDLAESLLKRDAGVKDSSRWLPGFGGVLDLLDSILGAAPVAYVFWTLGLVGP